MRPIAAWMPAIACATTSQVQKPCPGSRLRISATSPHIQPTVKTISTRNPTYLWTSGIGRGVYGG